MARELNGVEDRCSWNGRGVAEDDDATNSCLTNGDSEFRKSRFREVKAIMCCTNALQGSSVDRAMLYSNRCEAYCRLSKILRSTPARISEKHPISELDPMALGQLALRDAEKVVNLRSQDPVAYLRKATALTMMDQYEAAVEAYLSGLEIDPTNKTLQDGLREVKTVLEGGERNGNKRRNLERLDDLDCILCFRLLHQPITTPCGHSFCRQCLLRALDYGNKCPLCRAVIFVSPKTCPVSVTLNKLIERNCPEECEEREAEMDADTQARGETLPLYVMDVLLPMQHRTLLILEPQYRLMIRRVAEGNHHFGMVDISESGSLADVACEVELIGCEHFDGGQIRIKIVGKRRFLMTEIWEQDGYRVARVQWLQDTVLPDGSPEKEQLDRLVRATADSVHSVRRIARSDRHRTPMVNRTDGMPSLSEPERFSFWVVQILDTSASERMQYLQMIDTHERLLRELARMQELFEGRRCGIQ